MTTQGTAPTPANGATSAQELFALTDEQILEIEPVDTVDPAAAEQPHLPALSSEGAVPVHNDGRDKTIQERSGGDKSATSTKSRVTDKPAQPGVVVLPEDPPAWLARQMKDPWSGEEARELWEGVQRAQAEAAEYKQVFEKPEEARSAAERARALDEFDAAYFGAAGKSAEEIGSARAALAQRMMREDPAAFAEMVAAGVKALEEAKKQGSSAVQTHGGTAAASQQES